MGFEPTRAEHIGLAVQRLNHSATSSDAGILSLGTYMKIKDSSALPFTVYAQLCFGTTAFCFVLYYEYAASDTRDNVIVTTLPSQLGCLRI